MRRVYDDSKAIGRRRGQLGGCATLLAALLTWTLQAEAATPCTQQALPEPLPCAATELAIGPSCWFGSAPIQVCSGGFTFTPLEGATLSPYSSAERSPPAAGDPSEEAAPAGVEPD